MAWREELLVGNLRANALYLGSGLGTLVTASATEINNACDLSNVDQRLQSITTATYNVEITDSGKLFMLNRAGGIAVTLPTVATSDGCIWEFVVATNFTSNGTIVTDTSENKIHGIVVTGADGTATTGTAGTAGDVITFANGADEIGDYVRIISDGVFFYATCFAAAAAGITITTAS